MPDTNLQTLHTLRRWTLGVATAAALAAPIAMAQPRSDALRFAAPSASAPVELTAREIQSVIGGEAVATGDVQLRQGGLMLSADVLRYNETTRLVIAHGKVEIDRGEDRFKGSELQLQLDSETGYFLELDYYLSLARAGGHAQRIDFQGPRRYTVVEANYTSCQKDDEGNYDWLLSASRIDIDLANNEAVAEGAVLRFLGVPILALPALSFPVTDERKSGWLPPSINLDSRSGIDVSVPYYWNIAPNVDATLTPGLLTRRGVSLGGQLRYLGPSDQGRLELYTVPYDSVTNDGRYSIDFLHRGDWGPEFHYGAVWQDASDDIYWKDFPHVLPSVTPRLLPQDLRAERSLDLGPARASLYARVQRWRVLRDADAPIDPPYERSPQLGVRSSGRSLMALDYEFEAEANRFQLRDQTADDPRSDGSRAHISAALSRRFEESWGWITPRLWANAAVYDTDSPMADGRTRASRLLYTGSVDSGLVYERSVSLFNRGMRQTLEPRAMYVYTPVRDQHTLPIYDLGGSIVDGHFVPSGKDFNEVSIYSENAFSGIDRISDGNQLTFGATSRLFDNASGAELLRFGVAQRVQFQDQQLTPDDVKSDGRFSDLLLFGATTLVPSWTLDGSLQFNSEITRAARSILSARYHPAEFHTVSGTYRYTRGMAENFELGWQWPIYRGKVQSNGCGGHLYGVGRVDYSMRDTRVTDAILGLEYDAGCWIARLVVERVSTGLTEATTRPMLQLELTGLSRLGSNPLQMLKDNIPGYRLLREDRTSSQPGDSTVYP